MTPRMWKHQREALSFIDQRLTSVPGSGVGVWAGMGAGKSRICLEAIRKYDLKRVLILAPKSVTEHVWADQVEAWAPEYTCLSLGSGSVDARCKKIQKHADTERLIVVLNYEAVYRKQAIKVLGSLKWDGLVLDEAHRISRPGGKTSRTVRRLAEWIPFRLALSGTPISGSQGPLGIWAIAAAIDPRVFQTSFSAFRAAYTTPTRWGDHDGASAGKGGAVTPWKFHNLQDLQDRMASFSWRVETDDVLDLPEETDVVRSAKLEPAARRLYQELENDLITDLDEGSVTLSNALVRLLRLQQLTGGSLRPDGKDDYVEVSTAKAALLADVIEDFPLKKSLVVVCRFHHDMDVVERVAIKAGRRCYELSGRKNELRQWKSMSTAGHGPVLAMQIQSGGIGISLVESDTMLWYSPDFSLTSYDQSRARIRRPGQRHPVTFVHLTIQNSVDQYIYAALRDRTDLVETTLEALRR